MKKKELLEKLNDVSDQVSKISSSSYHCGDISNMEYNQASHDAINDAIAEITSSLEEVLEILQEIIVSF